MAHEAHLSHRRRSLGALELVVTGAVHLPLGRLRARLREPPRDQEIDVLCRSGQRAYDATRILLQHGFDVRGRSCGVLSHAILAPLTAVADGPGAVVSR